MNRIVTTRSSATRARRARPYRPRLEFLEVRAQPGSILWGDIGLSLATPALDLDLTATAGMAAPTELTLRRPLNVDDDVPPTDDTAMATIAVTGVSAQTAVGASDSPWALPAQNLAVTRQLAAVVRPVGRVVEARPMGAPAPVQQESASANATLPPPVQLPAQPTTKVAARVQVTTDYQSQSWMVTGDDGGFRANVDWASFTGSVNLGIFKGVAVNDDLGSVVMVGNQTSAGNPAVTELVAAKISPDGSTATFLTLSMGTTSIGNDIAVDNTGVAYVVGSTNASGNTDVLLARIKADFSGFDWVATIPSPSPGDVATGVQLDSQGHTLYLGGTLNNSFGGGHTEDVLVGKFSDLANPSGPQQDALVSLVFAQASTGTDISLSRNGHNVNLSGTYSYNPGVARAPALFRVDASLANQQLAYFALPGLTNDFNSLDTDPRGYIYATGRAVSGSNFDLFLVKYNRDFTGQVWSFQYDNPVDGTKEFFGVGITVDSPGFSYVTGRDAGDVLVAKFEQDGASIRDSLKVGGSGIDGGAGLARAVTGDLYIGGRTASADFPVTQGVFQPTYGCGASDGLAMKASQFA